MNDYDVISETDNSISEIGGKSKSKYKWIKSKAKKYNACIDDSASKQKRLERRQDISKKNFVRIGHYYDDRGRYR